MEFQAKARLRRRLDFFFLQPAIGTTDAVRLRCGRVVYTIWEMPRAPLGYRCRNVTGLRCWFGARDVIMLRCSRIAVYITSGSDTAAKVAFDDIPCTLLGRRHDYKSRFGQPSPAFCWGIGAPLKREWGMGRKVYGSAVEALPEMANAAQNALDRANQAQR